MPLDNKNLIDTRGRQSLMSTSSRRRDSVQVPGYRERSQPSTPEPPTKMRRPDVDLGAILRPEHIPSDKYYAVQSVIFEQDKLITDRENDIKDRCKQISLLHKDLKDANARIDRDQDRLAKKTSDIAALEKQLVQLRKEKEAAIRESRNRKRQFDEMNDDLFEEDLIKVGKKILAEKNQEVERLAGENTQLRATVGERDGTISSLNDQILRVCTNSGDDRVAIALEAQAQRTLSMVNGLKKEVARGDTIINDYKAKHEALITANESLKTENADLRAKLVETERISKAVHKRATEQRQILDDQSTFIEKLMKDNARIVEASQRMKLSSICNLRPSTFEPHDLTNLNTPASLPLATHLSLHSNHREISQPKTVEHITRTSATDGLVITHHLTFVKKSAASTTLDKMCYAFIYTAEQKVDSDREIRYLDQPWPLEVLPKPKSLKRSADSETEQRQVKARKLSDDIEEVTREDIVQKLKTELANVKVQKIELQEEVKRLGERTEELEDDLFPLQAGEDRRKEKGKGKSQDAKAQEKQAVQKARESWKAEHDMKVDKQKADYQNKLDKQKTEYEQKYNKLKNLYQKKIDEARKGFDDRVEARDKKHGDELDAKDKACRTKIEDYKKKNSQLEAETKEAKTDLAQTKKQLKEEHETLKKDLKEKQQSEIRSWKPEHSKQIKARDDDLKDKNEEIKQLKDLKGRWKTKIESLQENLDNGTAERDGLKAVIAEQESELEDRQKRIDEQHKELDNSTKMNADLINSYQAKLQRRDNTVEEQRKQLEEYKKHLLGLQRQQFQMRDALNNATEALNKATKRIEYLETQLSATTEQSDSSKASSGSGSD